ncbi:hypothetical protein B5X24_HaOG214175 [Helicoverpa armigera]|uniref:Uncharacterized protein n=1 Tax=Helicoverpa armigera TaxID=29058 RepID=A0A2W1BCL3_HELAM|nr:hypothetical protein B5X24_HaOG214175 [Helicoverpa armigera]
MAVNTESFISAIQSKPPIWQSKHPHHNNRTIIRKLSSEIKEQFPISQGVALLMYVTPLQELAPSLWPPDATACRARLGSSHRACSVDPHLGFIIIRAFSQLCWGRLPV